MNIKIFIEKFKNEAINLDLKFESPRTDEILQKQKNILLLAESESEINEVLNFSKKGISEAINKLNNCLINESFKNKYSNCTAPHLIALRVYLEYRQLQKDSLKQIEIMNLNPKESDELFNFNKYKEYYNPVTLEMILPLLNDDKDPNQYYYAELSRRREELSNKEIYESLENYKQQLNKFNRYLCFFSNNIVKAYKGINDVLNGSISGKNDFNHFIREAIQNLESISVYSNLIKDVVRKDASKGSDMQEYCKRYFEGKVNLLKIEFGISILDTPIQKVINKLIDNFKNAFDIEKLKFLQNVASEKKLPQQNESNLPNDIVQLLEKKDELKYQIKKAKGKVIAQEKEIVRHRQRAEDGLNNTLAFEQKQIATYESELKKLQKEYSNIKIKIKALKYNNAIEKQPQQIEIINPDEGKKDLHNAYFKDNAFEVWQSMFTDFKIKESSRTDVKFMFEIMKYEKLIHPTVTQTALLNWINDTYQLTISKARYIDFKNDTKRLAIFNKAKST